MDENLFNSANYVYLLNTKKKYNLATNIGSFFELKIGHVLRGIIIIIIIKKRWYYLYRYSIKIKIYYFFS